MSEGSLEFPETGVDKLTDAIVKFTGCIGESLEGICSYSWTIGETYVPFLPDDPEEGEEETCTEEESNCSQAWVRVTGITPSEVQPEGWDGPCEIVLKIHLEVGVLRCVEVPENGEAPTATDVMAAAIQSMTDMDAILMAALGCDAWEKVDMGTWSPDGPLGGQYGGIWTFDVEL